MTTMEDLFEDEIVKGLRSDMIGVVTDAVHNSPRSLQVELGPSEVGHPCPRRIAMGLMNEPSVAWQPDALPSAVGTGSHDFFAKAFMAANEKLGRERWLVEHRVNPFGDTEGNLDLFDTDTRSIVDHKFLAKEKVEKIAKGRPRLVYERQGQQYGAGLVRRGYKVDRIIIWALPRGGTMAGSYCWHTKFDPTVTEWVEQRLVTITALCFDLRPDQHPERYNLIPADTSDCSFCSWKVAKDAVVTGAHCKPQNA